MRSNMRSWDYRSKEIAYLLNPAYCGKILYSSIKKYNEASQRGAFPFALTYLILPLMLYPGAPEKINAKSRFSKFVNDNPELFINFGKRTSSLITITNEAIEFLMSGKVIVFNDDATLSCFESVKLPDEEMIKKSRALGKMLATAGSTNFIYLMLGVKP